MSGTATRWIGKSCYSTEWHGADHDGRGSQRNAGHTLPFDDNAFAALHGVVVASDRMRKRQAGLAPDERGGEAAGLYDAAHTERTYAALLERAAPIASSGRAVVLDATFAKARHREAARAWGHERGLAVFLAEASCAEAVALARLEHR